MIEAKLKLGALDRTLIALRNPDLRKAWREGREPLKRDMRDHRAQQRGPDGPWAPRAASTKERSRKGRGRARRILGRLPTALQTVSTNTSVAMKSRVPWSDVQRSGGTVGHGAKIPARDFLWASQLALDAIADIIVRHLARIWNRGG